MNQLNVNGGGVTKFDSIGRDIMIDNIVVKGHPMGSFHAVDGVVTLQAPTLMNLADSHMGNFDSFGDVAFVGGGDGMHTIDNMRGNVGSTTTFSI